ncbi:cob(I)yrinic acid a,c-diamide adenosyltransferase [Spirochaetota bacterium]
MDKGYVQVYTGNGKGKTTAAIGLCVRALGAGFNVYFAQFIKAMRYSEIKILESLSASIGSGRLVIKQFGRGCFIMREPETEDIKASEAGLEEAKSAMLSGNYGLMILDELNVAIKLGLLPEEAVLAFLDCRPAGMELVITGRYATDKIMDRAHLVTEMKPVRHYYDNGIEARTGIER